MQRVKIEGWDITKPLLIIGGINLIILMVWNIADPVVWVRGPVDEDATSTTLILEETSTLGYCNSDQYRVYLGLMLGVNYVFSVVALVQAYECRKISTDYGEFLWIGSTLIAVVQVWTIGLPLLKLLDDDPRGVFFVKVGVVFLTTMLTLFFIFIPKIRHHQQSPYEEGPDPFLGASHRETHSVTSRESEEDSPKAGGMGKVPKLVHEKTKKAKMLEPASLEGIRIFQTNTRHSAELEKLRKSLGQAESRHKSLNDRLERLQEKLEQYLVSRHPQNTMQGSNNNSNNFILSARAEQVHLPGQPEGRGPR